ncbi:BrnA antitoxin family protein [Patescibacteria group bacterium]|nr:BrnA antitoxin family protein [Patescibacteria group bacterium]MBU4016632.1 BrnA antitoxin family protein [Patescibacteria group bacterium]MBU4098305.1 BrnA antitoxin family protein [Patescibacteria group bacterium]
MKKLKQIPKFKNENEEAEFWATHDSTDYFDISKAMVNPSFPNLKLSTKTITIRIPESLLESLKMLANKKDVPYQSLVKMFLDEKVKEEFGSRVKHAH